MANQQPVHSVRHSCCWCDFKWQCPTSTKDSSFCKCQWQEIGCINNVRQILYWCSPACQQQDMNGDEEEDDDEQMLDDGRWHSWK